MSTSAGEEPPSGIQGKGTANQPYDQGNAPEQTPAETAGTEGTGTEPLSGAQGKGTVDEPYDKGNVSVNKNTHSSSLIDGILGRKKGTVIDTATGAPPADSKPSAPATGSDVKETAALAAERHEEGGSQQKGPDAGAAPTAKADPPNPPKIQEPEASPASAATTIVEDKGKEPERGRGKEFASYSEKKTFERSVSPGTKPDGSHAQTDGDRGMGYNPPRGLGKLGAKLGIK